MLELCLWVLIGMADPATFDASQPDSTNPIATCARPSILVAQAHCVCAAPLTATADQQRVKQWLAQWQNRTENVPGPSRSKRDVFRQRLQDDLNEHTLVAAEQFLGPVNVDQLIDTFDWRITEITSDRVCLQAVPRDELEQLFYKSFSIGLNAKDGNLEQLTVITRNQLHRTVWESDRKANSQIKLVRYVDGVPPAPGRSSLRTAKVRTHDNNKPRELPTDDLERR